MELDRAVADEVDGAAIGAAAVGAHGSGDRLEPEQGAIELADLGTFSVYRFM
jgi:hypothetical protein